MVTRVVDTTVIAVANGLAIQASDECVQAAVRALGTIKRLHKIGLDDGYKIFSEYMRYANLAGEPGIGDEFLKHIFDNMHNEEACELVTLTPTDDGSFQEFPAAEGLKSFDRSDRKFVCVALGCSPVSDIYVAGDRGWQRHRSALDECGVTVVHLCEQG